MRRISDVQRKKILAMWLAGDSYRAIQHACLVALATIHMVKEEAKKETPDLEDLRTLNTLLRKSNVDFYDTLRGANLLDKLNACGVSLDDLDHYLTLTATHLSGKNRGPEEIIEAAIKLLSLEDATGKSYREVVEEYRKLRSKLTRLRNKCERLEKENKLKETANSNLDKRREKLAHEIRILGDEKHNQLHSTASLTNIADALENRVLHLPCKRCGKLLPVGLPTKREYTRFVSQYFTYKVRCQGCGNIEEFPLPEILLQIGWTLLPP